MKRAGENVTRVVDYGGLFHDDVKPGHKFGAQDHRGFRPAGWVEAGAEKMERMRDIARNHKVTMLQLACLWNLSQPAVSSVIPTLIQETGANARAIESKVDELASLPDIMLTEGECEFIAEIRRQQGLHGIEGREPGAHGRGTAGPLGADSGS